MSKIKIPFHGVDYEVYKSSLSAAHDSLKNHLLNVMNGSGTTIKLGGVSYGVDSAKFAEALNSFASHLRTISGNDYKVIVNRIEYLIDAAKINGAIDDLHAALDNLRPLLGLYQDGVMIMLWDELLSTGAIKLEDGALSIGTGVSIEEPTSPELNEYGFYFNIPYNAYLHGMKVGFVFFEDGSIEMLQNGQVVNTAPAGSVSYGDSSVDMSIMSMGVCMFSADGTSVEMDGIKLTCGEPELNEYGFYYGEQYIATAVNGTSIALAFYEDGSVAALANGQVEDVLPAGSAIYSHGNIDMSVVDFGSGIVSEDGTSITFATLGYTLSLKGKAADLPGNLSIPDDGSITSINDEGFRDCAGLISIEIPNSVTSIGANAFAGCAKLTNVTFDNLEGWYVSKTKGATGGSALTLADANANATHLKSTYCNYYWYKSESGSYSIELKNNMADMGTATFANEYNGLTSINLAGENTITMIASVANSSYVFVGWYSGDTLLSSSTTYTHTFTSGQTVEARFDINYTSFTVTSANRTEIGYTGEEGENLVIPETFKDSNGVWYRVTSIGSSAFYGCTSLESIEIPASVTELKGVSESPGWGAFRNCTNLESVTFAEGSQLTTIGVYAFDGCTALTDIEIPFSVTSIGDYAFNGCTSLTSIEIPNSVVAIGTKAFSDCTSLTSVTFEENSQLTTLDGTFDGCTGLISIEIPDSVTLIDAYAFRNCSSLETVLFGENSGLSGVGLAAFYNCTALTNIELPTSVTWIRQAAFKNCTGLTSIDISNATTFEHQAFMGCTGLTSIEILSAKTLGDEVFRNCSNVTSVTIGSSVTSIGPIAFGGMSSLEVVYYEGTLEQWCKISYGAVQLGGIGANPCSNGADLYINGNLAKDIVIPNTVTAIRQYAFPGCTSLTSVEIPESVTSIGVFAFTNCSHLESVTILEGTATIGQSAFNNCVSLTSVTIPASVTTIGKYAFQSCTKLNTITYNGTVVQWNAITKQTNWKYYVPATHAICSDGTVAL